MAGFEFNIDTGQIDRDDTKELRVVGKDDDGNKVTLSAIDFQIKPNGGLDTTYALGDFNENSKEYTRNHTFSTEGLVTFDVTITDQGGNTERETKQEYVYD